MFRGIKLARLACRPMFLLLLFFIPWCTTGCALTGRNRDSALQQRVPLTRTADELRRATPLIPALPRELELGVFPPHIVRPGDTLQIVGVLDTEANEERNLNIPARLDLVEQVLPEGIVDLGELGRLYVTNQPIPTIEATLANHLNDRFKPNQYKVFVSLASTYTNVAYVLGDVREPRTLTLLGTETVLDAIVRSGGLLNTAAREDIILIRPTHPCGCRVVLPICYDEIVQVGDVTTNYQLLPGDRIFVPTRALHKKSWLRFSRKHCLPCNQKRHLPCPQHALHCDHGCTDCIGAPDAVGLPTLSPPLTSSENAVTDPAVLSDTMAAPNLTPLTTPAATIMAPPLPTPTPSLLQFPTGLLPAYQASPVTPSQP